MGLEKIIIPAYTVPAETSEELMELAEDLELGEIIEYVICGERRDTIYKILKRRKAHLP
jgi:hypothetical protein